MIYMSAQVCLTTLREILDLPGSATNGDIVAAVRETKAVADLAGEALKARQPQGCAACDRADYQLGHADNCPKSARDLTGTRNHRIP